MAARLLFIKFGPSVDHRGGGSISADRFLLGVHKMSLFGSAILTLEITSDLDIKEKSEISDPVHSG